MHDMTRLWQGQLTQYSYRDDALETSNLARTARCSVDLSEVHPLEQTAFQHLSS